MKDGTITTCNPIKYLAKRTLRAEQRRNLFTILTIGLSACMMLVVALYFSGTVRATKEDLKTRYQFYFVGVTQQQIDEMRQDPSIEFMGEMILLDTISEGDYQLRLRYMDQGLTELNHSEWKLGGLPSTAKEIVVDEGYLQHTGQNLEIGDNIILPSGESFQISGILKSSSSSRIFTTIVSKEYALNHGGAADDQSVYLKLANTDEYYEDDLRQEAELFAQRYSLDQQSMGFSSYYLLNMDIAANNQLAKITLLFLLVASCAALVVYSIFYVSVIAKINEYGRMKTLGATRRQIKNLVNMQANRLTIYALIVALPLGNVIAYLMIPAGYTIQNSVVASVLVGGFCWLSVRLAVACPANMAAKVTPVEAVRFVSAKQVAINRHPTDKITPLRLAKLNMARNPKKAILTLCSLGVCGVLLVSTSSYLNSLDLMELARRDYPFGDLTIQPAEGAESFGEGELLGFQQGQIFNKAFEQKILKIDGVMGIKHYRGIQVAFEFPSGLVEHRIIDGITREEAAGLDFGLEAGEPDSLFSKENVFWLRSPATFYEVYHWSPQIGDKISIQLADGSTRILTLEGILHDRASYGSFDLFISEDLLNELSDVDTTYQLAISTQPGKTDFVEDQLRNLCAEMPELGVVAVKDYAAALSESLNRQKAPIYVLVALLGIFGLINLVNTLMTNLFTRKKELAAMQAIGLSDKQLRTMLIEEGLLYSFATIIISLVAGSLCGIGLCKVLASFGTFGAPSFQFPYLLFAVFASVLILVQIIASAYSTGLYQKTSLIERMRTIE